jgi:hypothetical protein
MKRIKSGYYKVKEGEWMQPIRSGYRLACCDCGLVHLWDFRIVDAGRFHRRIQFRVFLANRSTAMKRRKPHRCMLAKRRRK